MQLNFYGGFQFFLVILRILVKKILKIYVNMSHTYTWADCSPLFISYCVTLAWLPYWIVHSQIPYMETVSENKVHALHVHIQGMHRVYKNNMQHKKKCCPMGLIYITKQNCSMTSIYFQSQMNRIPQIKSASRLALRWFSGWANISQILHFLFVGKIAWMTFVLIFIVCDKKYAYGEDILHLHCEYY